MANPEQAVEWRGEKPRAIQIERPKGEHIFHNTRLTQLATRWKELNSANRHSEAMELLEEIVIGSTPMFERLAQHEGFHHTVDLGALVSAAQEKVVKWLIYWEPKKGTLFSWFSKCSKNAFRSEVVKMTQYRKRHHVTSDNLEQFYGMEDHEVDRRDAAAAAALNLQELVCRWGDPQEIGAIKYCIVCIVDEEEHDKQATIRSAAYAYGIPFEMARFFYNWALVALRDQMYEKIRGRLPAPAVEELFFIHWQSYSQLPNFLTLPNTPMEWRHIHWMIATHGGQKIKIPTMTQFMEEYRKFNEHLEIDRTPKDPHSISVVAAKHKRPVKTASESYLTMLETMNPNRSGEYEIFES